MGSALLNFLRGEGLDRLNARNLLTSIAAMPPGCCPLKLAKPFLFCFLLLLILPLVSAVAHRCARNCNIVYACISLGIVWPWGVPGSLADGTEW